MSGIPLSAGIYVGTSKPADAKYLNGSVPYASTTEVNTLILQTNRHRGLTVNINGDDYWYKDGTADNQLILKQSGGGSMSGAEIKAAYEAEANTNAFTDAEKSKLSGVEAGATGDQTGAEIKAAYEAEANTNAFTDAEKSKLAGLEGSKWLGTYPNLSSLQSSHPSPVDGSYADVDAGVGVDVQRYIWDSNDNKYVVQGGNVAGETAASIKTKYESNADTNAFTDAEKSKLSGVEAGATGDQTGAEIKAAYEAEANTNAFTDAAKAKNDNLPSDTNQELSNKAAKAGDNSQQFKAAPAVDSDDVVVKSQLDAATGSVQFDDINFTTVLPSHIGKVWVVPSTTTITILNNFNDNDVIAFLVTGKLYFSFENTVTLGNSYLTEYAGQVVVSVQKINGQIFVL